MTERMRAVVVTGHGGVDVLEVQERDRPEPAAGQVVIEVAASGVNFIDVYQREGIYPVDPPFVLGGECAGRVTAVGDGVDDIAVDDVVATAGAVGSHAQFVAVDAAQVVGVPPASTRRPRRR